MCVREDVKEESDVDSEAGGIFSTEEDDLDYELDRTSESEFELMWVFTLANIQVRLLRKTVRCTTEMQCNNQI